MTSLRLRPDIETVWATPTTFRFGIDHELVTLEDPPLSVLRFIAALRDGIPRAQVPRIAGVYGLTMSDCEQLLEQLRPVLLTQAPPTVREMPRVHIVGTSVARESIHVALTSAGCRIVSAEHASIVVLLSQFATPLTSNRRWAVRGLAQLPVVFGERNVSIGPLLGIGNGPCLHCLQLSNIARDPNWVAIASQCLTRRAAADNASAAPFVAGYVAAFIAEFAKRRLSENDGDRSDGQSVELRQNGQHASWRTTAANAACLCQLPMTASSLQAQQ